MLLAVHRTGCQTPQTRFPFPPQTLILNNYSHIFLCLSGDPVLPIVHWELLLVILLDNEVVGPFLVLDVVPVVALNELEAHVRNAHDDHRDQQEDSNDCKTHRAIAVLVSGNAAECCVLLQLEHGHGLGPGGQLHSVVLEEGATDHDVRLV